MGGLCPQSQMYKKPHRRRLHVKKASGMHTTVSWRIYSLLLLCMALLLQNVEAYLYTTERRVDVSVVTFHFASDAVAV